MSTAPPPLDPTGDDPPAPGPERVPLDRSPAPMPPAPPNRPPFAPPPGTPWNGPPPDATWTPPPGTAFGGGVDVLAGGGRRRDRRAWPAVARPVPPPTSGAAGAAAPADRSSRAVAVLLAVAATVAAIVTARASLVASDATGAWASSVSQEQRRGAILLEGVRSTYGSEGDAAFMIVSAEVRADELRARAALSSQAPDVVVRLETEARTLQQVVDLTGGNYELITDPRYRLASGGVDLQLRLADDRAEFPEDVAIDPPGVAADGDREADQAVRLMATTLAIGIAFLFGALAQAFRRRRRGLLVLGWAALGASAIAAMAIELGILGGVGPVA